MKEDRKETAKSVNPAVKSVKGIAVSVTKTAINSCR